MTTRHPTSLNINPLLWKEAKIEAIRRGITVTELVESALEKEIGGGLNVIQKGSVNKKIEEKKESVSQIKAMSSTTPPKPKPIQTSTPMPIVGLGLGDTMNTLKMILPEIKQPAISSLGLLGLGDTMNTLKMILPEIKQPATEDTLHMFGNEIRSAASGTTFYSRNDKGKDKK